MMKLLTRAATLLAGLLVVIPLAAVPASASAEQASDIEYHIETGPEGVKYKVITAIDGRPLVDQQGDPAPAREPLVSTQITETDCYKPGGDQFRPGPVKLRQPAWPFTFWTCFQGRGTTTSGLYGTDLLRAGHWSGAVYIQGADVCTGRPFDPGDRLQISGNLCALNIQ